MSGGDGRVIVLLRGVNVGGRNRLPMVDLARLLEGLGLEEVATYIQSGNAVGRSAGEASSTLGEALAAAIEERHGFRPRVLVLGAERLSEAVDENPFPEASDEPGSLHLFFLARPPPSPDLDSLAEIAAASERFHLARDIVYLHTPDGFGRSKLAAKVERLLGVPATARNWRTVNKLREMVDAMP